MAIDIPATPANGQSIVLGGKAFINQDGKLNQVQEVIDSIYDETERIMAQLYWDDSTEFERIHPTLVGLGTALGLTEAELDMMFINASKL